MKNALYLKVITLLAVAVFLGMTGCAKKETVVENSAQPQNAKQEEMKSAPAPLVATGEQKFELGNIHFDFDKYNLRPADRKILNAHANWLLKNSEYKVKIEGNCDERGTEEYNMALGQRRADTARKYLTEKGINAKRISTISYGKDRPLDPAHNEEAWAKNRNDQFVLSP